MFQVGASVACAGLGSNCFLLFLLLLLPLSQGSVLVDSSTWNKGCRLLLCVSICFKLVDLWRPAFG